MARRQIIVIASCGVLAGCGFGSMNSNFAFPKLSRVTIPEIHLLGVPLYGEKLSMPLGPTRPYRLSPAENDAVRLTVTQSFPDTARVRFYPLRSGLTGDGTVSVCGMVSARSGQGTAHDRLFRGDLVRQSEIGTPTFSVRQISGANAAAIDVLGDCQKQGLT